MKTTIVAAILTLSASLLGTPANAEQSVCTGALTELSILLEANELPTRHLVKQIRNECTADVGELVGREIGQLKINVLTSQIHVLDATRIESYDQLKQTLGKSGAGKRASGNQAFGVALQALTPVLSVHLQEKLNH